MNIYTACLCLVGGLLCAMPPDVYGKECQGLQYSWLNPLPVPNDKDIGAAEIEVKEVIAAKRSHGGKVNRATLMALIDASDSSAMKFAIAKILVHNSILSKTHEDLIALWDALSQRYGVAFAYSVYFTDMKTFRKQRIQSPGDRYLNAINARMEEVRNARQQRVELRKALVSEDTGITLVRLGDMCVAAGDWNSAMEWYSKSKSEIANYALADRVYLTSEKPEISKLELGDYWWSRSESNVHHVVLSWMYRMRAVSLYEDALSEDSVEAVKKSLMESRIAKVTGKVVGEAKEKAVKKSVVTPVVERVAENPKEVQKEEAVVKAGTVLTGTQKEPTVTLGPRKTYTLKNQYIVPDGSVLLINEGTQLVFEPGSGMTVQGKLVVSGSKKKPVVFRGASIGKDVWQGVKFFGFNGSSINYAHFSCAKDAINLSKAGVSIAHTTFYRNHRVLHTDGHYSAASTLEDCMICENDKGVTYHFADINFKRCTFQNNVQFAILGDYYGAAKCDACIITKNGAGLRDGGYDGFASAHRCCIYDNDEYDVNCRSTKAGEFSENYWGPTITQVLKKEGDGYRPASIKGNFVDISKFLEKPPRECGAYDAPALIQR